MVERVLNLRGRGMRGPLGIELDAEPVPGQFLVKSAGSNPRKFSTVSPPNQIADAVRITDLAAPHGASLAGFIGKGASPRVQSVQEKMRERRTIFDKTGGIPDGVINNRSALLALIADGGGIIPAGTYVVDSPILIPAGTILTHEGSPTIIYTGAKVLANTGVFKCDGDDIHIRPIDNSTLSIKALNGNGFLYCVDNIGHSNIEIGNVKGINCCHYLGTTSANSYANVNETNQIRNIHVYGGGAAFDEIPIGNDGACYIGYSVGVIVENAAYENCVSGIQWWGGDSNQGGNGIYLNKRKVSDLRIRNVKVDNVSLGCIWGSMGQNIRVIDCDVSGALDVGLDSEGSYDVKFINCTAKDCVNGAAATFFISENVEFINCTLEANNGVCFRSYNSSQAFDSRSIALRGCTFIGTGNEPSTVDAANGPVRSITVSDCTFDNAIVSFMANNLNQINITNNRFKLDKVWSLPHDVIAVGAMHGFVETGQLTVQIARVLIDNNKLFGTADQPNGTRAIYVYSDDSNYPVSLEVSSNKILIGVKGVGIAPMVFWHAGTNAGVILNGHIHDNKTDGPIQTRNTGGAPANFVTSGNMNFALNNVAITGV